MRMMVEPDEMATREFWEFIEAIYDALEKYKGYALKEFSHRQQIEQLNKEVKYSCDAVLLNSWCVISASVPKIARVEFIRLMKVLRELEMELVEQKSKRLLPLIRALIQLGVDTKGVEVAHFHKSRSTLRRKSTLAEKTAANEAGELKPVLRFGHA